MKIGIVLDTTALLAYARIESVAVGELIAVVRDDGDVCAAPALALLDVWNQLKPPEQALLTDLFRRDDPPVEAIPFVTSNSSRWRRSRPKTASRLLIQSRW